MTLYGKIVEGELVDVGDLPPSALRLSTNQIVHDLAGVGAIWQRDCGWFDLNEVDPTELTSDPAQLAELEADIATALAGSAVRRSFADKVRDLLAIARTLNWQWIDRNCHPQVAAISFIQAQSPTAGAAWPTLAPADKLDQLQLGVSLAMAEFVRLSQADDTVLDILEKLIERSPGLTPPSDR